MDAVTWQTQQFEHHRPQLRSVAYRMLGSVSEADDAVQETWLRLNRSSDQNIENMPGWLTTVVGRVCIDMLRSRQARREDYFGTWLPEPIVGPDDRDEPEQEAVLADSVGLALLVVLEQLNPAERLAFVLHDMFGVPFDEIAPIIERTPAATRQLASRARRTVRGAAPNPDQNLGRQREVVDAFLAASRAGDFNALVKLLDPNVVFRIDSGARDLDMPALMSGADAVAHHAATQGPRFATVCRPAMVNGAVGIVAETASGVISVAGITVVDGRITSIDLILDPRKLSRAVDNV